MKKKNHYKRLLLQQERHADRLHNIIINLIRCNSESAYDESPSAAIPTPDVVITPVRGDEVLRHYR